jgi:hypothetical protein
MRRLKNEKTKYITNHGNFKQCDNLRIIVLSGLVEGGLEILILTLCVEYR